jgi:hypothetical protein
MSILEGRISTQRFWSLPDKEGLVWYDLYGTRPSRE